MKDIENIESLCKKLNYTGLPALKQLKAAVENNSKEDAERIALNIINFIKLERPSSFPNQGR